MSPIRGPSELEARARRARLLNPGRALIVVGSGAPSNAAALMGALRDALADENKEMTMVRVDGEQSREVLERLNRERERLLATQSLVAIVATSPEAMQIVQRYAVDLLVAPDIWFDIAPTWQEEAWPEVATALRRLSIQRCSHMELDFLAGLRSEHARIPLRALYIRHIALTDAPPGLGVQAKRWLLLGEGGSGKTTFLRFLALSYAEDAEDPLRIGVAVPVLVPLHAYGRDRRRRIRSLRDFIPDWLHEQGIAGASNLEWGQVALLLDGLDELADADARRDVLEECGAWVGAGAPKAVVITGRDQTGQPNLGESPFLVHDVPTLTRGQCKQFAVEFSSVFDVRGANSSNIFDVLDYSSARDAMIQTFAARPLSLTLLLYYYVTRRDVPGHLIAFYHELVEHILQNRFNNRAYTDRTERKENTPSLEDIHGLLGGLALFMADRGLEALSAGELHALLEEADSSATPGSTNISRDDALQALSGVSPLFRCDGNGSWSFIHSNLLDYFGAAATCSSASRWTALLKGPFGVRRSGIVTLSACYVSLVLNDAARLHQLVIALTRLRQPVGPEVRTSLWMDVVRIQPGFSARDQRELIRRIGADIFSTPHTHPEFALTTHHLASEFLASSLHMSYARHVRELLVSWFGPVMRVDLSALLQSAVISEDSFRSLFMRPSTGFGIYWGAYIWGPLLPVLHWVLTLYGLDTTALETAYAQSSDLRLRYAAWLIRRRREQSREPVPLVAQLPEDRPPEDL